jgi:hypothetical protein
MKSSIIFIALLTIFTMTGSSRAQSSGQVLDFSESFDSAGNDVVKMTYVGEYDPALRLYAGNVVGPVEKCFENRSITLKRGIDQDKTLWQWRSTTGTYDLTWVVKRGTKDSCRVIFASRDGRVDTADFMIWQRNVSTSTFFQSDAKSDDSSARTGGDGSVRSISYSIALETW